MAFGTIEFVPFVFVLHKVCFLNVFLSSYILHTIPYNGSLTFEEDDDEEDDFDDVLFILDLCGCTAAAAAVVVAGLLREEVDVRNIVLIFR